jgi:hypothetical protein
VAADSIRHALLFYDDPEPTKNKNVLLNTFFLPRVDFLAKFSA